MFGFFLFYSSFFFIFIESLYIRIYFLVETRSWCKLWSWNRLIWNYWNGNSLLLPLSINMKIFHVFIPIQVLVVILWFGLLVILVSIRLGYVFLFLFFYFQFSFFISCFNNLWFAIVYFRHHITFKVIIVPIFLMILDF